MADRPDTQHGSRRETGADLTLTVTLIILLVLAVLLIANLIGAINVFG